MARNKLIRVTTIALSLEKLLENQLRFMRQYYEVIAISSDEIRLQKLGIREGVKTYSINLTRNISPIADLRALCKLYLFLKRQKPLIIHTHTPKAGIVGMLASKLANVPIRLHTVAGLPLMEARGFKRKLLEVVEKLTYRCATRVYPNSRNLRDYIITERLSKPEKLKVLKNGSSNGINTEYFDPGHFTDEQKSRLREQIGILPHEFVFIFVGRIVGDKGINELVTAYLALSKFNKGTKLLLIGPKESELDPLSPKVDKAINVHPDIISLGYQTDVRPFFAISNVLVFPSYREGFPNVVMQGGAMGLPAIVSDINGCNEIIIDGENGMVIPAKDVHALTTAMTKILVDTSTADKMRNNARRMIIERYRQIDLWNEILAEYRQLEDALRVPNYKL